LHRTICIGFPSLLDALRRMRRLDLAAISPTLPSFESPLRSRRAFTGDMDDWVESASRHYWIRQPLLIRREFKTHKGVVKSSP
jgi:hypothetical protein